jgi:hypothetical protein
MIKPYQNVNYTLCDRLKRAFAILPLGLALVIAALEAGPKKGPPKRATGRRTALSGSEQRTLAILSYDASISVSYNP